MTVDLETGELTQLSFEGLEIKASRFNLKAKREIYGPYDGLAMGDLVRVDVTARVKRISFEEDKEEAGAGLRIHDLEVLDARIQND